MGKVKKLKKARKNAKKINMNEPAKANPAPGPTYANTGITDTQKKTREKILIFFIRAFYHIFPITSNINEEKLRF